jgi:hypothetical protein
VDSSIHKCQCTCVTGTWWNLSLWGTRDHSVCVCDKVLNALLRQAHWDPGNKSLALPTTDKAKELHRFVTTRLVLTGAHPSFYLPSMLLRQPWRAHGKEIGRASQAEESLASLSKESHSCIRVCKQQEQQNKMSSREQLKYDIKKRRRTLESVLK